MVRGVQTSSRGVEACRFWLQVHCANTLVHNREEVVVKLVDIPTSIHDECRQVWHSPIMLNRSLAGRRTTGSRVRTETRWQLCSSPCGASPTSESSLSAGNVIKDGNFFKNADAMCPKACIQSLMKVTGPDFCSLYPLIQEVACYVELTLLASHQLVVLQDCG